MRIVILADEDILCLAHLLDPLLDPFLDPHDPISIIIERDDLHSLSSIEVLTTIVEMKMIMYQAGGEFCLNCQSCPLCPIC